MSLVQGKPLFRHGEPAAADPRHMADDDERMGVDLADELLGAVALAG